MKQFIGEKLKNSKVFGAILVLLAVFGLCNILWQIFTYDSVVRPFLFELPQWIMDKYPTAEPLFPAFTTNNVSGFNTLAYFTQCSNIITDLYLLALGFSILGWKRAQKFGFNKNYGGAATMFIAITGIIYTCMMLPFLGGEATKWIYEFPGLAYIDFLGYWHHMVIPVLMIVIWNLPYNTEEMDPKKFRRVASIFPTVYAILTVLRGFFGGQYLFEVLEDGTQIFKTYFPYPFLAPDRFAPYIETMFGQTNDALNVAMTVICYILCIIILAFTPILIAKINNKYVKFLDKKYKFLDSKVD